MTVERAAHGRTIVRRRRGQIRLQQLLQATDALLCEMDINDIGLYQIAERAGVPPSSIYHFFNSKGAALAALAEELQKGFARETALPLKAPVRSWQELHAEKIRSSSEFYARNRSAMILFFGPGISAEVRSRDVAGLTPMAEARAKSFDAYFVMPEIEDWIEKLCVAISIVDGVWSRSYVLHREITPQSVEEAIRASTAYLRCFLPEHVALRPQPDTPR